MAMQNNNNGRGLSNIFVAELGILAIVVIALLHGHNGAMSMIASRYIW